MLKPHVSQIQRYLLANRRGQWAVKCRPLELARRMTHGASHLGLATTPPLTITPHVSQIQRYLLAKRRGQWAVKCRPLELARRMTHGASYLGWQQPPHLNTHRQSDTAVSACEETGAMGYEMSAIRIGTSYDTRCLTPRFGHNPPPPRHPTTPHVTHQS
ncbi:hypothetical protein J6590_026910 [Homalodisca vitripennis]|nr:hypothetical protein J6590_026910 [Homalodisca vitripennis]